MLAGESAFLLSNFHKVRSIVSLETTSHKSQTYQQQKLRNNEIRYHSTAQHILKMVTYLSGQPFEALDTRMKMAGISGMWLCCSCETGYPKLVKQHKIGDRSPWKIHDSVDLQCLCGHRQCDNCHFVRYLNQPGMGLETNRASVTLRGEHFPLRLSTKTRHFKCDYISTSSKDDDSSVRKHETGGGPQCSIVVPFPEFRPYKRRESFNFWVDDDSEVSSSEPEPESCSHRSPDSYITNPETSKDKSSYARQSYIIHHTRIYPSSVERRLPFGDS